MIVSAPSLAETARDVAATLLGELDGVATVLIADRQGRVLAHAGRLPVDPGRLAALAASLVGLGDAAGRDAGIGAARCLVVESAAGRILVRGLQVRGDPLVALLVTDGRVLLAVARSRIAQLEQALSG